MMQFRTRKFDNSKKSYYCWVLVNGTKVGNALILRVGGQRNLYNFNILPAYRNRGYATAFMEKIIEHNGKLNTLYAKSCDLENGLSTKQLVKFYKKFGFKIKYPKHPFGIMMTRKAINHCEGV